MVGHRDRAHAGVDGSLRVVDPGHALEHERAAPLLAQPGDVVPGRRRRLHPLAVGAEEGRPGSPAAARLGTVRSGMRRAWRTASSQRGCARASGAYRSIVAEIDPLRDGAGCPSRGRREGPVKRDDQPDAPAVARARSAPRSSSREPIQYDLEERLRVGGDDLLDRLAGEGTQPHHRAARRGGSGDRDLAVRVDGLDAGRRDQHRQRDRLADDRGGQVPLGGRPATCGAKPSSPNAATLSSSVAPRSEPAMQRAVHRLGQPLAGPPLRLSDGLEPRRPHRGPVRAGTRDRRRHRTQGTSGATVPTRAQPA